MKRLGQRNFGFTIVELLIVIVVIGILAGIVTVAYNGVQQRSRDAETASDVKQYLDALKLYYTYNGTYPGSATESTCLGVGYSGGKCWLANVNEDPTFMTALERYKDSLPILKQGSVLKGGIFSPAGRLNKVDGVNTDFIAYIIPKSGRCPVGPIVTYISGQLFSSEVPESGQSTSPNAYGDVQCWIPLER